MSTPEDRVIEECKELDGNINRLFKFTVADKFKELSESHRMLLRIQLPAMQSYRDILLQRIKLFQSEKV